MNVNHTERANNKSVVDASSGGVLHCVIELDMAAG